MLKEIGIESYYVLINGVRRMIDPNFPTTSFDHAILAIHLPDSIPDAALFAIAKDLELGRLLFFDPTNEYVPLGYLPYYLQNNYGLVAGPNGGELIRLPLLPPPTNRVIRTAKITLSQNGGLDGSFQEIR